MGFKLNFINYDNFIFIKNYNFMPFKSLFFITDFNFHIMMSKNFSYFRTKDLIKLISVINVIVKAIIIII